MLLELTASMKLLAAMEVVVGRAMEVVVGRAVELVVGRASAGSENPATRTTVVRDWSFMFAGWVKFESVGLN